MSFNPLSALSIPGLSHEAGPESHTLSEVATNRFYGDVQNSVHRIMNAAIAMDTYSEEDSIVAEAERITGGAAVISEAEHITAAAAVVAEAERITAEAALDPAPVVSSVAETQYPTPEAASDSTLDPDAMRKLVAAVHDHKDSSIARDRDAVAHEHGLAA